jgi:protein-disulfide isomerase
VLVIATLVGPFCCSRASLRNDGAADPLKLWPTMSRTRQKEEARARRVAEEKQQVARKRRQRRVLTLGGVVLGAAVVVAVAIAISSGGGATGLTPGNGGARMTAQIRQLLGGIPQSGASLGNPKAPVTMTYYSDLQCPVCADFTLKGGFPELLSRDVRSGQVRILDVSLETATRDPQTFQTQQVAALAAGRQNHLWDYLEAFYRQQGAEGTGYVTNGYLTGLADEIPGLDISSWRSARNDSALINRVQSEQAAAVAAGVQGTPTLIFQGPRGKAKSPQSVPSYSELEQAIKSVT